MNQTSKKKLKVFCFLVLLILPKYSLEQVLENKSCDLAEKYEGQNNFNAALIEWSKCLQNNPSSEDLLMSRGICYMNLTLFDKAKTDFNKIMSLNPKSEKARFHIIWISIVSGKPDEALTLIDKSSPEMINSISFKLLKATAHKAIGNFTEAIESYSSYLEIDSLNQEMLAERGECYLFIEEYIKGINDFTKAIKLTPNESNYYALRAICKKGINEQNSAMLDFNKAIQLNVKNDQAFLERGRLKFTLGDERGAISDYDKAIVLNATNSISFYFRAISKSRIGDHNGALIDINKCISLEAKMGDAYYIRGFIKLELNNLNGACTDFSKAGELGIMDAYDAIKENCN